ncbi:Phospholipase D active site motif domain protein [Alloalcanivorax dieselolei B5]|uniref:Phospholipase D active site motif domain protein n=1 Tax=Alcanivorax dieselolei (strain DSM 16502 / CGMCC 1.3690 / MCCC 1A00001 / B-5) TaxID=930169 RepID=K0CGC9_ALCDB|nr:phospholipase D-like domain-containing protein [Alloalcanivorax dieselolei]AFT71410.1 Phospholipase D active site motif domain protein [Alloalcanivorax dieselolei B5]GGK08176.1 phospholipase [Alloalcanivorax dieselolei]
MSDFLHTALLWLEQASAWLEAFWLAIVAPVGVGLAVWVTVHVAQHKRDARAAAAWTGLVWLVPFLGALLYLLLGVNRIQRRARQLTGGGIDTLESTESVAEDTVQAPQLRVLSRLVGRLTRLPLTAGNRVTMHEAREALHLMAQAVDEAQHSVFMATYIFGNDAAGKPLVEALTRAAARGVQVRVLLDGVGALYSLPSVTRRLRKGGVRVERFLHSVAPWRMPYMNLRNHRKLMIVDHTLGFTGGMNVRAGYVREPARTHDLHARLEGPVVAHLLRTFAADWMFTCGENLTAEYQGQQAPGTVRARGISAGPDADFDKRRLTLFAAIGSAEREIRIVTPYFVPDQTLMAALQLALLKGVKVEMVVPRKNNLRLVQWASIHALKWLVHGGAHLYLSAPPFDHSKVMTVDGHWVQLGSGNWDARSLRLNFEFDLECYDGPLAEQVNTLIDGRIAGARRMDDADFQAMAGWRNVRNALAHMLEPYL